MQRAKDYMLGNDSKKKRGFVEIANSEDDDDDLLLDQSPAARRTRHDEHIARQLQEDLDREAAEALGSEDDRIMQEVMDQQERDGLSDLSDTVDVVSKGKGKGKGKAVASRSSARYNPHGNDLEDDRTLQELIDQQQRDEPSDLSELSDIDDVKGKGKGKAKVGASRSSARTTKKKVVPVSEDDEDEEDYQYWSLSDTEPPAKKRKVISQKHKGKGKGKAKAQSESEAESSDNMPCKSF